MTDTHSQQQQQQQLQENNNSSSRDAKKPQEGPDEMWAPGALGHHRELPVDVPDTLLQKAYPNKVKNRSCDYRNGLQRPRSASDLSLNLKNETLKTRTIADVSNDCTDNARNGGLQASMLKIELKIEDEEEKVRVVAKKYHESPTGSPDLKSTFEDFEEGENTGGQRESSVDVEDDYPFAKEDYPTMLKTCSDDSASPRSSSGRSDSTAPLDTILMLKSGKNRKDSPTYDVRRIDLGSPCRSVVPDIKVAPLFGRARDATSFDNPAYGLTDLQDLQGLLMRSDEVSDLTRLIDEQCSRIPRDQEVSDQQPDSGQVEATKPGKSSKRRQNDERAKIKAAKTRSLDIEELIGSTDDLLNNFSSSSRQRPKKKRHQQISSGYSTLRSEASGDLEHDRSFLVVGGKAYREVAVDCPPDFVPVTKCHPVYPPPNKTPGNSKHNTLEPRREPRECEGTVYATTLVASPCLSPNDNSLATLSSADDSETVVARATVDSKPDAKKVRFKNLLLACFHSYREHRYWHCNSLRAFDTAPASSEPVLRSFHYRCTELREVDRAPIRTDRHRPAFGSNVRGEDARRRKKGLVSRERSRRLIFHSMLDSLVDDRFSSCSVSSSRALDDKSLVRRGSRQASSRKGTFDTLSLEAERRNGGVSFFAREINRRDSLRIPAKCLSDDTRAPNDPHSEGRERHRDDTFQDDSPSTQIENNGEEKCSKSLDVSLTLSSGSRKSSLIALASASSDFCLSDLRADYSTLMIRPSLSESDLCSSKVSSSWRTVKWNQSSVYSSNQHTQQDHPPLENDTSKLREDTLKQQVNRKRH